MDVLPFQMTYHAAGLRCLAGFANDLAGEMPGRVNLILLGERIRISLGVSV